MSEMVERVARAICAHGHSDFCRNVGGDLGCKVGRGIGPSHDRCIANRDQLYLSGLAETARAAIEAMREPTDEMVEAGVRTFREYVGEDGSTLFDDPSIVRAILSSALEALTPPPAS